LVTPHPNLDPPHPYLSTPHPFLATPHPYLATPHPHRILPDYSFVQLVSFKGERHVEEMPESKKKVFFLNKKSYYDRATNLKQKMTML
jgi:hypothetical protein